MYKLRAAIIKDIRILFRDRVGLTLMFVMPIILAVVITSIQNNTFELVNNNKVPVLVCNYDKEEASEMLLEGIYKIGMFDPSEISAGMSEDEISGLMRKKDALVTIVIPEDFTNKINAKAENVTFKALKKLGISPDNSEVTINEAGPLTVYFHPVLQESYRFTIQSALRSVVQIVENKIMLQSLYMALNEEELPQNLEEEILHNQIGITEKTISREGTRKIPNATQHNIPAWTIFAMFFIVISLGSNIVKEKRSGSFIRLKTLPTNYMTGLISKQITYLGVSMAQVFVIFSIGIYLFPLIGLPELNLPSDIPGLILVSIICGWCALSYAICIGVFAQTQEQANGIGAVSIVILAAIGGLLVPDFAMPGGFKILMILSPLHWCLESYYDLFLEGGKLQDVFMNVLPLLIIIVFLQLLAISGLKRKNLI